jgi:hypothetical protein
MSTAEEKSKWESRVSWSCTVPITSVSFSLPSIQYQVVVPIELEIRELKKRVDIIYEALRLILGDDLEKILEEVNKDEATERGKTEG